MISLAYPWWRKISDTINVVVFIDGQAILVITVVTAWVVRMRMRRRVKMDLGKTVDDNDLLSIQTWMKVDEVEKKKNPGGEWAPESTFLDRKMSNGARSLLEVLLPRRRRIDNQSPTRRT